MGEKNLIFFRSLRSKRHIYLERRRVRNLILSLNQSNQPIKLNIGSSTIHYEGWISLDLPFFDLLRAELFNLIFDENKIDNVLMEHVLEHLTNDQVKNALLNIKPFLKRENGRIRIAIPDRNHPNPSYIDYVKPNGCGPGSDDHKSFWNIEDFQDLSEELGFILYPIEYYDRFKKLHTNSINLDYGPIRRTAQKPNVNKAISDYSSLIIDLTLK